MRKIKSFNGGFFNPNPYDQYRDRSRCSRRIATTPATSAKIELPASRNKESFPLSATA